MIDVTVWATAEAGAARCTAGLVCDARSGQESPSGVFAGRFQWVSWILDTKIHIPMNLQRVLFS